MIILFKACEKDLNVVHFKFRKSTQIDIGLWYKSVKSFLYRSVPSLKKASVWDAFSSCHSWFFFFFFFLSTCLFGTLYWSPSEMVYDRSVFWYMSVYSICVVGLLVVFCKIGNSGSFYWKNLSYESNTKEKETF